MSEITVTFNCNVKESKNAINNLDAVKRILEEGEITFGKTRQGHPGIWIKWNDGDKEKEQFVARLPIGDRDYFSHIDYEAESGNEWEMAYTTLPNGMTELDCLFFLPHATDKAKAFARNAIEKLIEKYDQKLNYE
jgi:hypothetical protein